jgi:hypothetical protein
MPASGRQRHRRPLARFQQARDLVLDLELALFEPFDQQIVAQTAFEKRGYGGVQIVMLDAENVRAGAKTGLFRGTHHHILSNEFALPCRHPIKPAIAFVPAGIPAKRPKAMVNKALITQENG